MIHEQKDAKKFLHKICKICRECYFFHFKSTTYYLVTPIYLGWINKAKNYKMYICSKVIQNSLCLPKEPFVNTFFNALHERRPFYNVVQVLYKCTMYVHATEYINRSGKLV